jgi:hypothetical protein
MFETCTQIRGHFSDYLDGMCAPETLKSIRYHLGYCGACREELDRAETLQADLRSLPRRRVPAEVALQLRVCISQQLHHEYLRGLLIRLENSVRPVVLPASGGVLAAVIFFGLIMGSQVVPVTNIPDVPLQFTTPPRVQELAPIDFNTGDQPVVVLTSVNAGGRAMGYKVLSGQHSPELMQRLDQLIYFSLFQPATMFGKPTDGQVVLSLRRITVRG